MSAGGLGEITGRLIQTSTPPRFSRGDRSGATHPPGHTKCSRNPIVPDCLLHLQSVGIRGREGGQGGAGGDALLEADVLGVGGEEGRLVDVLDGDGDACRGLKR